MRCYQLHAEQERAPRDAWERRGYRSRRGWDGLGSAEVTLTDIEVEELDTILQAFIDLKAEAQSARADCTDAYVAPIDAPSWPARRADALMEMARVALAHLDDGQAMGADRYLVHVVTRAGELERPDGTPIDTATADRITCDASSVVHRVTDEGEPLRLGRKTRHWNTAQRRAITIRDSGHCRFPGCERTFVDIHHLVPWDDGGPTDTANGLLACARHHTLIHAGFIATGDGNHTVAFHRPNGSLIGTTAPRRPAPAA